MFEIIGLLIQLGLYIVIISICFIPVIAVLSLFAWLFPKTVDRLTDFMIK